MSEIDSFIQEVTEEVRRDRLFRLFRKYGWIAILLVVVLVGGAAVNEWTKARARSAAEGLGDSILAAVGAPQSADRQAALQAIEAKGDAAAMVALMRAAESTDDSTPEGRAAAVAVLTEAAAGTDIGPLYRSLIQFRLALLQVDGQSPEERIAAFSALTTPGAAFRTLAEEQIALAEIDAGRPEDAIARLAALAEDNEATPALRQRAQQLIVALGGDAVQN